MSIEKSSSSTNNTTSNHQYPFIMAVADRPDAVFVKGKGDWIFDQHGKKYLDFVQGWAVNCLGHCPDILVDILCSQARTLWNSSPAFYNQPMLDLAGSLATACEMDQVFFSSSGAEANEGAIKLARKWAQINKPNATQIITTHGSFHGRTLATMSASGKPAFEPLFNPKLPGFKKVPFDDIDAMTAALDEDVIAVMLEPIQGEAGVVTPSEGYLQQLERLCRQKHVLLILDEIQTGMGRTGQLVAAKTFGLNPDIITLGKGLGGGAPMSALLAKNDVCCFQPGDQGGTFSGTPLLSAVSLAVLNTINRVDFLKQVRCSSRYLADGLVTTFGTDLVRGKGLLLAVDRPAGDAVLMVEKAREKGLLINAPNDYCLRFMPALNVKEDSIDKLISILNDL